MRKVYKDRLLKLADFLANTVPRKHFSLDYFTRDNDRHTTTASQDVIENEYATLLVKLHEIKKDFQPHKCGAVACAIGWLPAVFPRSFMWDKEASVILRCDADKTCPNGDFDVVEEFLGLNINQVHKLFTTDYYPKDRRGPKSVANKIRNFVKTGKLSNKEYEVEEL